MPNPVDTALKDAQDMRVFISTQESSCDECGEKLGKSAWVTLAG
jgi:hypothetical protein